MADRPRKLGNFSGAVAGAAFAAARTATFAVTVVALPFCLALAAGLAFLVEGLVLVAVLEVAFVAVFDFVLAELVARETGLLRLAVFVVFFVIVLQKSLGWGGTNILPIGN